MTTIDVNVQSKSEWVEVFPFGVAVGVGHTRPVMIFKDKEERRALPVWLSPMDAGIAVSQSEGYKASSPHELSAEIFLRLKMKLEKCLFRDVRNHQQYVELHFAGSRKLKTIEVRADDAISFCLRLGCRFYATLNYIEQSRVLEGEKMISPMTKADIPERYLN